MKKPNKRNLVYAVFGILWVGLIILILLLEFTKVSKDSMYILITIDVAILSVFLAASFFIYKREKRFKIRQVQEILGKDGSGGGAHKSLEEFDPIFKDRKIKDNTESYRQKEESAAEFSESEKE